MLPLDGRSSQYSQYKNSFSGNSGSGVGVGSGGFTVSSSLPEYLRRACDWHQMDLEATCDQMVYLLTVYPQRVYKSAQYRKQTKNQWARDDPGFALVQCCLLVVACVAFGLAFQVRGFWSYIGLICHSVLLHWLLMGVVVATIGRAVANAYLLQHRSHSVEQTVEWLYAFDVHCNSFFLMFMLLYVVQFLLLPILLRENFIALLMSNALYAAGFSIYAYITCLGYQALPFLHKQGVFLWWPVVVIGVTFAVLLLLAVLGIRINLTRVVLGLYL
ncbi:unnamed protein product [Chrysoparadoxa australica]